MGDFLWLASKLLNTGEKFNIIMPDSSPQRGHQLADLLPGLIASHTYKEGLGYRKIARMNIIQSKGVWKDIKENSFALSANQFLEAGKRIERFLPDLPTTYKIEFTTKQQDKDKAAELLPAGPKYIGIYTSAYKNARHEHYNGWSTAEWFRFCSLLYKGSRDFCFVIIGAPYDSDLSQMLMDELIEYKIPFINTVGQPLGVVVEILKRLFFFAGFPSGLSILNEYMGKDGLMWYGKKISGIINTWADPARIKNGNIKECLFTSPENIYEWLKSVYQIFER